VGAQAADVLREQQGLMLDDAADKEALESLIDQIRPAAIKLDPLYLMFNGDINSAKDLSGVLQWCLYIKQTYNCAVILVHHYAKGKDGVRGGQKMLGSTTLHGWIESAWYLQVQDPEEQKAVITLEREFRGAGLYGKIDVDIKMGPFGDPHVRDDSQ
jgi:RecA-family ATPase